MKPNCSILYYQLLDTIENKRICPCTILKQSKTGNLSKTCKLLPKKRGRVIWKNHPLSGILHTRPVLSELKMKWRLNYQTSKLNNNVMAKNFFCGASIGLRLKYSWDSVFVVLHFPVKETRIYYINKNPKKHVIYYKEKESLKWSL